LVSTDLVGLVGSTNSTPVAIQAAFTLRSFVHENPSQGFSLVNILLNHITIQNAELMSASKQSTHLFVRSMMHFSIALASVIRECLSTVPADILGAIVNTANTLIDPDEIDMVSLQRKSCGYILLIPVVAVDATNIVPLLGMWRSTLGKKSKDTITKLVMPGQTISDISLVFEYLQSIQSCLRSMVSATENSRFPEIISSDESVMKMFILLLNNGLQILQSLVPLEQSSSNAPHIQLVVSAIRNELFRIFSALPNDMMEPFSKSLISLLPTELLRETGIENFFPSFFSDSNSILLDVLDPFMDEQPHLVWKYSIGASVMSCMRMVGQEKVSSRDFFNSPIACGVMEEFYTSFPSSNGSPWCPQIPYISINWSEGSLGPLSSYMEHPNLETKKTVVKLLTKLVALDPTLIDSLIPIVMQKYREQVNVTSQDYETARELILAGHKDPTDVLKCISKIPSTSLLGVSFAFFTSIVESGKISPSSASSILTFSASPTGLGSVDPFVRRSSSCLIGLIYKRFDPLRPMIVQCVMDSSTSPVLRTRSATAALVAEIVSHVPSDISVFGNTLFKLARELQNPLRSNSLHAISICCTASLSEISPWIKELVKISTAHAMADIYRSDSASFLLSSILASVAPIASFSGAELGRFDLLWTEFVRDSLTTSPVPVSVGTARACISYASSSPTDENIKFVRNSLSGYEVVVRQALTGLMEIFEQPHREAESVYPSLFAVAESYPNLRTEVDQLLTVLVRTEKNFPSALASILTMLSAVARVPETSVEVPVVDEYAESDEYDDEEEDKSKVPKKFTATKPTDNLNFRITTVSNKWLALKCIKRILKQGKDHYRMFIPLLDPLVNAAVAAVSSDKNHEQLSKVGMKLVGLILEIFGSEKDPKYPQPLLLQYETQLLSVARRGARMNSESPPIVQRLAINACATMVRKNLVSSRDKLIEILIQPFVSIDPIAMAPWSSYYALREITNTVVAGRSSPLTQSSEQDLALILFSRINAIVDLIESLGITPEFGDSFVPRFQYYLIRILMDCHTVLGLSLPSPGSPGFVVLSKDTDSMKSVVEKTVLLPVLRGLAVLDKSLDTPSDYPASSPSCDLANMYSDLLSFCLEAKLGSLGDITGPLKFTIYSLGKTELICHMNLFKEVDETDERFLRLAHTLVSDKSNVGSEIVWNLVKNGTCFGGVEVYGDILFWLCGEGFFTNVSDVELLIKGIVFPLFQAKSPQPVVKVWREIVDKVSSSVILGNLVSVIAESIGSTDDVKNSQVAIVLAIPLFGQVCTCHTDERIETSLIHLRDALLGAARSGMTGPVIQCAMKFFASSPPDGIVTSFILPLILDLIEIVGNEDGADLVTPLIEICPTSERKRLVCFSIKCLLTRQGEDKWGRVVLSLMNPPEVFRECVSELCAEDRSVLESVVRKYLPAKEETASAETPNSPKNQAPAIQLKLKFGK